MAQLNMRIDDELKRKAEKQFKAMGLTTSSAVSIFFAQVVMNHGIPFQVCSDPFYSRADMAELTRRAADMDAGVNCSEHELIGVADSVYA